jgi:prenyltransferase beta subunit
MNTILRFWQYLFVPSVSILIFLVILLIFTTQVEALSVSVDGNCVDDQVTVTVSEPSFVIFRMNNGTPVYAFANPSCHFIPKVTGILLIKVISKDESLMKYQTISTCEEEVEDYYPTLPEGSFTKQVGEKTYAINWRTALGALEKASQIRDFSYTLKETAWGLFVDCIMDKCSKSEGDASGWMYWVNYPEDPLPGIAAGEYHILPGDEIVWYFSRSMDETPETSPYRITIEVGLDYRIDVHVEWRSETVVNSSLNKTTPNQSYDVSELVRINRWNETVLLKPDRTTTLTLPAEIVNSTSVVLLKLTSPLKTSAILSLSEDRCPPYPVYGKLLSCFAFSIVTPNSTTLHHINAGIEFRVPRNVDGKVDGKMPLLMVFQNSSWIELMSRSSGKDKNFIYYFSAFPANISGTFAVVLPWKNFPLKVTDEPIVRALNYLKELQLEDGGFANPEEESDISKTSWAIIAIAAAYQDPHTWIKNGNSPVDYLKRELEGSLSWMGTADIARTILAVIAAGENPRNFSGVNLVELLKKRIKEDGRIGDYIYTTIWGVIALKAAGENVSKSVEWLKKHQNDDGGFAWAVGERSDYDDTAAAIQALIAAGEPRDSRVIKRALEYLKTGQNEDGGFRYFGNSSSNAASDSWIIQALVAAGENPRDWGRNNISVVDHLLSLQSEEGYFRYTKYESSNPGYMTVCAIMALLGRPHPVLPTYRNYTQVTFNTSESLPEREPENVNNSVLSETSDIFKAVPEQTISSNVSENYAGRIIGFELILSIIAILICARLKKW